jgi:hypothetical protein
MPPSILLSCLGRGRLHETIYELGHRQQKSLVSALALSQLVDSDHRPDEVWMLVTPEAANNWGSLEQQAKEMGICVRRIDLTGNEQPDDTADFLERVAERIPAGAAVTLDVTQGLRHHAFLFYALALYLSTFREVSLQGAWYCRFEIASDPETPRPFIDLQPVLELSRWFLVLSIFRQLGITEPIASLLQPEAQRLRNQATAAGHDKELHGQARGIKNLCTALNNYSFAYSSALPLELGRAASSVAELAEVLNHAQLAQRLPLMQAISGAMGETARTYAYAEAPRFEGQWKEKIILNEAELSRQAKMIDEYFQKGNLSLAVGLLREWTISWLMWKSDQRESWLGFPNRKPFEQQLGFLAAIERTIEEGWEVREDDLELGKFWNQISDQLRNSLMHHAMRVEEMERAPRVLKEVLEIWDRLKNLEWQKPEIGGGGGRLLVCPIGMTPGVLYSALSHVQPQRVVVLCSSQSASAIEQAIEKSGLDIESLLIQMQDPHAGVDEFKKLIRAVTPWIFKADELHCCLTGGTALMGVLAGQIANKARAEFQRTVQQFVLIDKRQPEEQRNNPWEVGEIRYL